MGEEWVDGEFVCFGNVVVYVFDIFVGLVRREFFLVVWRDGVDGYCFIFFGLDFCVVFFVMFWYDKWSYVIFFFF